MAIMQLDRSSLVKTLQELVRVPSMSGREKEVAEMVSEHLEQLGLKPTVDRYCNVQAEFGSGKTILLNAHLDTVPPGKGWTVNPYSGNIVNNKVFGLGASDNKSGVAAMLEIARVLSRRDVNGKVSLIFTSREESDKKGLSRAFIKTMKADAGISLDNHVDASKKAAELIVGCKGIANFLLKVFGKAYHSSEPHKGVNAIYRAVNFIEKFRQLEFPSINKPVKGSSTASITKINTDGWSTMVPDRCELVINYRAVPSERIDEIESRLRRVAYKSLKKEYELSLAAFQEGYLLDPTEEIVKVARDSVVESGFKCTMSIAKGWEDAAEFHNSAGIPIIGLGPTTPGQAHVKDEYEDVDNLVYGSEIVLRTALNYLGK